MAGKKMGRPEIKNPDDKQRRSLAVMCTFNKHQRKAFDEYIQNLQKTIGYKVSGSEFGRRAILDKIGYKEKNEQ